MSPSTLTSTPIWTSSSVLLGRAAMLGCWVVRATPLRQPSVRHVGAHSRGQNAHLVVFSSGSLNKSCSLFPHHPRAGRGSESTECFHGPYNSTCIFWRPVLLNCVRWELVGSRTGAN